MPKASAPSLKSFIRKLKRQMVDVANANSASMDATISLVKEIIDANEIVFAVWKDRREADGVGMQVVKGQALLPLLLECMASGQPLTRTVSAIKCSSLEQVIALDQTLGEQDRRH